MNREDTYIILQNNPWSAATDSNYSVYGELGRFPLSVIAKERDKILAYM